MTIDVLFISPGKDGECGKERTLNPQKRRKASLKEGDGLWRVGKDRVASRGDEELGLSKEQKVEAQNYAKEQGKKEPSDVHYRTIRNKPLLMIHILDLGKDDEQQTEVPAYGISFPGGNYSDCVKVVANPVWLKIHGRDDDGLGQGED